MLLIATLVRLSTVMRKSADESRMSISLRIYIALLLGVVFGWLWCSASVLADIADSHCLGLLGITGLYIFSHVLRMLRLTLLTLDCRISSFPLVTAHALTAFPSSFLPFKLGEVLRLAAFIRVFGTHQKAVSVWLAERFGDVLVIAAFILLLYVLDINLPQEIRAVFIIFVLASGVGLVGMFSVAKVFIYLNRHLVLTSLSTRGLKLLHASNVLRNIEKGIHSSLEGRISGFLLLSVLIWFFEILALSLFINILYIGKFDIARLFASGLLASLPSGGQEAFGIYQSLALVTLTIVFLLTVLFALRLKITRVIDDRY